MKDNSKKIDLDNYKYTGQFASIVDIESLLNEDNELDMLIASRQPIREMIRENHNSRIKGSFNLIHEFKSLDIIKCDLIESFSNIQYIGLDNREQVILDFPIKNIKASGIYDFSKMLYDKFNLRRYARFCIEENMHDILRKNIKEMFSNFKDKEYQYRFLIDEKNNHYLRAITSTLYKNYDNKIAIYSIIYALENLIKGKKEYYYVESGFIGDSSMRVDFSKESYINISKECKIKFGLTISNNEIGKGSLKVRLRYTLLDGSGKTFTATMEEPVCRVIHTMNLNTFNDRISEVSRLEKYELSIIDMIRAIGITDNISQDSLYFMLKRAVEGILGEKKISRQTKDRFLDLKDENIINDTFTLIQFFDKLNQIETDVDEKVFIERIFHQVIQELKGNKSI